MVVGEPCHPHPQMASPSGTTGSQPQITKGTEGPRVTRMVTGSRDILQALHRMGHPHLAL